MMLIARLILAYRSVQRRGWPDDLRLVMMFSISGLDFTLWIIGHGFRAAAAFALMG
jgi:hypothetical protein